MPTWCWCWRRGESSSAEGMTIWSRSVAATANFTDSISHFRHWTFNGNDLTPMRKIELPSAVCCGAFPADPDFPQLKTACDPRLMLEVFRRHLRPVSGKACQIQDCIPLRFRCRQSTTRCVLQYTLRLVEPGTGRQWNQWVTGLVYADKGEAERLWREMQAEHPRHLVPESWLTFEPVDFIPELQMLVQVFPYDRKLPNLCAVLGRAWSELEPLLLARLGPGQRQVAKRSIEPTRYRTELGAALRFTLQANDARTAKTELVRCYLKAYRNQRGEETFQLLRSFAARAEAGQHLYSVVRPIAYLSELRTLALAEAAGTPLQQLLLQTDDPDVLRSVARAVAAFNQDELRITRRHLLTEQFDDVKRASTLVQWACPQARADVK